MISLMMAGVALSQESRQRNESECAVTTVEDWLPSIIAPMAGEYPLWLVATLGRWHGADGAHNLYWVVARDRPGDLLVVAKRLGGS